MFKVYALNQKMIAAGACSIYGSEYVFVDMRAPDEAFMVNKRMGVYQCALDDDFSEEEGVGIYNIVFLCDTVKEVLEYLKSVGYNNIYES